MDKDRLDRQIEFIREIDKEKSIGRQTYLADASRKEDDAEHAWHMAIMTVLLSEYANEKIDVLRTMTMLLIHDLVEIDAGDTYAYDENAKKTQRERELKCADRIFSILPEDQGKYMRELWEEFEAQETPEAKFARTMDNFQPVILNDASKGKSWAEKGVHLSQILKRNARTGEGSEELWKYSYEIRSLSESSMNSADEIERIVSELLENSNVSVERMATVSDDVSIQIDKLGNTRKSFKGLTNETDKVIELTDSISKQINEILQHYAPGNAGQLPEKGSSTGD